MAFIKTQKAEQVKPLTKTEREEDVRVSSVIGKRASERKS